jgi:type IV pilus assembly protein PilQ
MLKWLEKLQSAVLFAFCLLLILPTSATSSEPSVSYEISDIKTTIAENTLTYNISGASPPVYTVSERFTPFRVVVDIAGASFLSALSPSAAKIPQNNFASVIVTELKDQQPPVMRFEFTLSDSHDYTVTATNSNLQVKLFPATDKNTSATSPDSKGLLTLKDFTIASTPNTTTVSILASSSIEKYKVDTIGGGADRPPRMYIDIDDVTINELVREKQIGTSVAKVRVAPKDKGVRIVFDSATAELFKYTVVPSPEGLNVIIDESAQNSSTSTASQKSPQTTSTDSTLDALIGSSEQLLNQDQGKLKAQSSSAKATALADDFSFSGYKKQRISVDFYKIDIHNVFRLFRQITDLNIIVDEAVQGSLTLALNNVPWDFALDIILNLMDLKKEERFNTIVIYPSKKEFVWPTRSEDNLAFEANLEVIEEEALVIEKSADQSTAIMQAKEFMAAAQKHEEKNEYENAAELYAKAAELWPENAMIPNRLATLYLVNLGMNAKAVFYAKQSLQRDPANTQAALYAAIGLANMQKLPEASEYFSQSISGSPPMKEALFSYAAFSENNGQNDAALSLLKKFESHYGETLETMVSKARILDKKGVVKEATKQYQAILASGFQLRPDLKKYIEGRLAAKDLH